MPINPDLQNTNLPFFHNAFTPYVIWFWYIYTEKIVLAQKNNAENPKPYNL
jgi:hypothetical protein